MRLALHFCDDSEQARKERRDAGKQYIECESFDKILDYFQSKITSIDVASESPTLTKLSLNTTLGEETIGVHFGSHSPRDSINYVDVGFALSKV